MGVTVAISDLKSIKALEFDVPMNGAFVVTGANGCGKTSLLIALHRMGAKNAFQTGLPGGKTANGIDAINRTVIRYFVNGKDVSYRYNNTRWSATPKSNSGVISKAFTEVLFLKADSTRVEPTPNELKGARKTPADPKLRAFMNAVFDTEKFNNLYQIGLQGRNATAHLIDCSGPADKKKTFYSEKAFSLGELCVMRLGLKLLKMRNGGLYIIDEFEMALHPAAQIRLFSEIEKMAKDANCCALVSTHSSSLIKSVRRGNIIYLENDRGLVTVHRNVYPTYALQHLTLDEESAPEKLIFVEDIAARQCVHEMWRLYLQTQIAAGIKCHPSVKIVVIGGYKEVLRFLERSPSFVPNMTRCMAALDADAEPFCELPATSSLQTAPTLTVPQELYQKLKGDVVFLPWTPEVGLCELLRGNLQNHTQSIQVMTGAVSLKFSQTSMSAHVGKTDKEQRSICKATVDAIAEQIAQKLTWSIDRARESLFAYLVQESANGNAPAMKALCGKLFS
jgi:predicted ATPase